MSRRMLAAALALALSCTALARNDDARALIAVQDLPCVKGGTVERCLNAKRGPSVWDMGWRADADGNGGYYITRSIQIRGLSAPTYYRFQVDRDGVARPVNGHARGIVRE